MLFAEMGFSPEVTRAIDALGFVEPTPIQEKVIPLLMDAPRDIIGLAQTGTGKTAAYGLPSIEQIDLNAKHPQLLILSPTRELCMQITKDLESFSKFQKGMNIVAVYGGAPMDKQIASLKKGAQVVVATPGRINDLIRRNRIDLSSISILVLDEADEMLKMGFREDVDIILAETPAEKTTLLFSATMSPGIVAIAKKYMRHPIEITMGKKNASAENVSHVYHVVNANDRYNSLKRIADYNPDIYGIVFCRTRQETKEVAEWLMRDGYNAEALHGDLSQPQRDFVMRKFRDKNLNLLVATDVAARGLDVNNLSHVINYNLPDDIEVYTHRSGRTGRAGKEGKAVSIIQVRERNRITQIEQVTRKTFDRQPVPGGVEICERQLFSMVERMQNAEVSHQQIDPYMQKVYDMLSELPKEEVIKRFVSLEFNRFLEYYKNAPDLNAGVTVKRNKDASAPFKRNKRADASKPFVRKKRSDHQKPYGIETRGSKKDRTKSKSGKSKSINEKNRWQQEWQQLIA